MTIIQIDRILAACERTGLRKTIKEADRIAVTAQATGFDESEVLAVVEAE